MHKSGCFTNVFSQVGRKCDHVMVGCFLDLINAFDGKDRFRFDLGKSLRRNDPVLRVHFAHSDFDVQPLLELVLERPDRAHFGQCVSFYHPMLSFAYRFVRLNVQRHVLFIGNYFAPVTEDILHVDHLDQNDDHRKDRCRHYQSDGSNQKGHNKLEHHRETGFQFNGPFLYEGCDDPRFHKLDKDINSDHPDRQPWILNESDQYGWDRGNDRTEVWDKGKESSYYAEDQSEGNAEDP